MFRPWVRVDLSTAQYRKLQHLSAVERRSLRDEASYIFEKALAPIADPLPELHDDPADTSELAPAGHP